jgi:hypothetical protein
VTALCTNILPSPVMLTALLLDPLCECVLVCDEEAGQGPARLEHRSSHSRRRAAHPTRMKRDTSLPVCWEFVRAMSSNYTEHGVGGGEYCLLLVDGGSSFELRLLPTYRSREDCMLHVLGTSCVASEPRRLRAE